MTSAAERTLDVSGPSHTAQQPTLAKRSGGNDVV